MKKGVAALKAPNSDTVVAHFSQTCHDDGSATVTLKLTPPISISGTVSLIVYSSIKEIPIVKADTPDGLEKVVHEMHGESPLGCLPDGESISLSKDPGGELSTLLIEIGVGTIKEEKR
jgi:hypothetical protein